MAKGKMPGFMMAKFEKSAADKKAGAKGTKTVKAARGGMVPGMPPGKPAGGPIRSQAVGGMSAGPRGSIRSQAVGGMSAGPRSGGAGGVRAYRKGGMVKGKC